MLIYLIYYLVSQNLEEDMEIEWLWTSSLSSNLVGNSIDETNFPCKLLLTHTQFSKLCKPFTTGS